MGELLPLRTEKAPVQCLGRRVPPLYRDDRRNEEFPMDFTPFATDSWIEVPDDPIAPTFGTRQNNLVRPRTTRSSANE